MLSTSRRITLAVLAAGGLALSAAPAAHAVVDPLHLGTCLLESTGELTTLVDPASLTVPPELPAVGCLQP
ncbi:hypothetical protein [Nonomuraea diastatica]|uniref:Uncharacterized protein n=1 Tax=Nonomuraea diastatica TaxID=1848329 RepID=A0A4R4WFP3_9ACTN|nr:hypothetical protein [Nonomuraea diastatica]TDD17121.1 hypothetical protein E1294_28890 [Nonomuraea diastatica]